MGTKRPTTILPPAPTHPAEGVRVREVRIDSGTWRAIEQTAVETVRPPRKGGGS